jgi:hypothetical protein
VLITAERTLRELSGTARSVRRMTESRLQLLVAAAWGFALLLAVVAAFA